MRPWDSAQPCARRQAPIDQGGFGDAAVTATARAATRQPRERLSESRPSRRSGPLRRPRSFPTRQSRGAAVNRSLNLLSATRIDRQKHVALIGADLRIADHCPDWPPRVPRLASRHAIPRGIPRSGDASHGRSRSRSLDPSRRPQGPGRGGGPELRTVPPRRQQLLLLRASTGTAALMNPDLGLSRHDSVDPVGPDPTAPREPMASPDFGGLTKSLRATAMFPGIALTAPSLTA
jgi:hypothetical protein